jgi:hypothetical protein
VVVGVTGLGRFAARRFLSSRGPIDGSPRLGAVSASCTSDIPAMSPLHNRFTPEEDTLPGVTPSARPSPVRSAERPVAGDVGDLPPSWRPRQRLESTTYSIVPEGRDASSNAPPPEPRPRLSSDISRTIDPDALSPAQRREIDAMHASLDALDYYELLGCNRDADAEALVASHEALASVFHAGRFAHKDLGPYRRKIGAIVARLHEAFMTLSTPERRAAYDARLASQRH